MRFGKLTSAADLTALVKDIGFLPFFESGVPGFDVASLTDNEWWTGKETDPWCWRVHIAEQHEIVYAKCMNHKAGFISLDWLPLFVNSRRDGYDFDARWDEGLAGASCHAIMRYVEENGPSLTCDIKRAVGAKGFEGASNLLQMQTYLCIDGFGRKHNRFGEPYGWMIGRLNTPEDVFGARFVTGAYHEKPKDSFERIWKQARMLCPDADEDALMKLIK